MDYKKETGENKDEILEELIINLDKLKNPNYLEQFINLAIIEPEPEPEPESESEYNKSEFKYLIKFIKGLKNDDDYNKHVIEVIDEYIKTLNGLKTNNSSLIFIKYYINKIKISFTLATSQYDISKASDELLYEKTSKLFNLLTPKFLKTYTFNIIDNEIKINHELLGDLFMRSEINHDFNKYILADLGSEIYKLVIEEFVINNTNLKNEDTEKIFDYFLKTKLDQEMAGKCICNLTLLSGIPLIKQVRGKLMIECNNNELESTIFPTIFNDKNIELISDADNKGNNSFSQLTEFNHYTSKNFPFLGVDAGASPSFIGYKQIKEPKLIKSLINVTLTFFS